MVQRYLLSVMERGTCRNKVVNAFVWQVIGHNNVLYSHSTCAELVARILLPHKRNSPLSRKRTY